MECGSYRGIKLLAHAMKVVERIFEHRIWQQIDMQFGFTIGEECSELEENAKKGNSRPVFQTVKKLIKPFQPRTVAIRDSTG